MGKGQRGKGTKAQRARWWTREVVLAAAMAGACLFSVDCPAADWADQRNVGPLVVSADFSLAPLEPLLAELAALQDDLVRGLGIPPAQEPIEVYLLGNQIAYRRFLRHHFPQVPYRRALYLKSNGPGRVIAYRHAETDVDLRHECTHALLHASLAMVPLWLDEGLAEYFEVPKAQRSGGNPYLSTLRWHARAGVVPSLEDLEKKADMAQMGQGQYRSAWAWVHFMLHGPPEAHDELVRFLGDIRANTPPGQLSARLPRRLPDLRREFLAHFRQWKG